MLIFPGVFLAVHQVPARRSISETLRAASTEEEPTEEIFDQLLEHLEESLMQVELSQHHAVLLKRAELHLLSLLGGLRDLLMRSLRSQARSRMADLVGCARASRLRAVLDSLHLSAGRCTDDRVASCRVACDAVDGVLGDFGLQDWAAMCKRRSAWPCSKRLSRNVWRKRSCRSHGSGSKLSCARRRRSNVLL
ncbi:unnamed protein product [Durusdinium trenchii]|uniref:Secreted protein n=1 Tax=Durusdinium trenchii TaxID=1381693 RepID=A0ABP0QEE7_9DINO